MNILKSTLLAAASLTVASAAFGADAIGIPAPAVAPVVPVASTFDWNGFYAGVRVGGENNTTLEETSWLVGAEIGVNAAFDMFVLGAELAADYVFADGEEYGYLEGTVRAGVLLMPEALVYGTVGYGATVGDPVGSGDHILAGLGVEFAVAENVSVDTRYVYGWDQEEVVGATGDIHKFTIGANFHF